VQSLTLLCLAIALQAQGVLTPAKFVYDAKRNETVCSTGDVRTAGYSGYGARFEFPGKLFSMPATIAMGFGALRLTHGQGPEHDQELLHWNGVDSITISFGSHSLQFPAKHEFNVSTNQTVTAFLGRALEESLSITVSPAQLKQMATADEIEVHLGKDEQDIKGKSLLPLKRLAAALPNS
jgi:hypothetical protein